MRKLFLYLLILVIIVLSNPFNISFSAISKSFQDSKLKDFEQGSLRNVILTRNGYLSLSSRPEEILNKNNLVIWDIETDSEGNLYVCTGNPGAIYKITKDRKIESIYEDNALGITSCVIDSNGNVYASISPENKLIKIDKEKKVTKICNFDEYYVWKLKITIENKIIAITGNPARLYEINTQGEKKELYSAPDEGHFLCLTIDKDGKNYYFGSEGKGILYQYIVESSTVKVLYDSYEDEIRDVILTKKNEIVFATSTKLQIKPPDDEQYKDSFKIYGSDKSSTVIGIGSSTKDDQSSDDKKKKSFPLKNSIYKYDSSGTITKLMTKDKCAFLSLSEDDNGNIYAGTGDEGIIYKIAGVNNVSIFTELDESQVLVLTPFQNNSFYIGTGNLGKLFRFTLSDKQVGEYTSKVFDATGMAIWGNITWDYDNFNTNNILELYTRSGNSTAPDKTWSDWEGPYIREIGEKIKSPANRYFQYRVNFSANNVKESPMLKSVNISYLMANRKPNVESIDFTDLGKDPVDANIRKPKSKIYASNVKKITWTGSDEDQDTLIYRIMIKKENENRWYLLEDNIERTDISNNVEKGEYIVDTRRFGDGYYSFKVIASDRLGNSPKNELEGSNISKSFRIDNTPPEISILKFNNENMSITFDVKENLSTISYCYFSLNNKNWVYIAPIDDIYDSASESFKVFLLSFSDSLFKGKNNISIIISDEDGNSSTSSISFDLVD